MTLPELTEEEFKRYARHTALPQISKGGQKKLKAASVLVVGAGGLGSASLSYLAAAGVGRIGIVDGDRVDLSNLQRQIIHSSSNLGKSKPLSAEERIREINPFVHVEPHLVRFDRENALELTKSYDLVLDGTDNFPTRYLINNICKQLDKPYVHGSISEFEGQCAVFWASRGPCYCCVYPEPPEPSPVNNGVLGVVPGIAGCMQAAEAVKLIIGIGESLIGRLVHFDSLKMKFREVKLKKNPECALCGRSPNSKTS